jgi:hypothetical protein
LLFSSQKQPKKCLPVCAQPISTLVCV